VWEGCEIIRSYVWMCVITQTTWPASPVALLALRTLQVWQIQLGPVREVQRKHCVVRHARQCRHLRRGCKHSESVLGKQVPKLSFRYSTLSALSLKSVVCQALTLSLTLGITLSRPRDPSAAPQAPAGMARLAPAPCAHAPPNPSRGGAPLGP